MASSLNDFAAKAQESKANVAHFFSPVDKGSAMPSWYHDSQVEELAGSIDSKQRQLDQKLVPPDKIMRVKADLVRDKQRLDAITEAQAIVHKTINSDTGHYGKRFKELEKQIKGSLYSRDQMFRVNKNRSASPKTESEIMVHRNHWIKEWKIIGRVLGEDTSIERLRKGH